jgi:FkbM family methyltransferase
MKLLPPLLDSLVAVGATRQWRGFHRLHRLLGGGRARWRNQLGLVMAVSPSDYIDTFIIKQGYYEREVFDALVGQLQTPSDIVWDIGANIGLHSLSLAKLQPELKIICFEPNPSLVDILHWQRNANRLRAVSIMPIALSDTEGDSLLYLYPGNAGMSSLIDWSGRASSSISVQMLRADNLIDSGHVPMPNLIKLDVEGNELAVLKGLGSKISAPDLRAIIFEDEKNINSPVKLFLKNSAFAISQPLLRQEDSSHKLENFIAIRV